MLSGIKIADKSDMEKAAEYINRAYGCAVLLKSGHCINDTNNLLYENGEMRTDESRI